MSLETHFISGYLHVHL